MAKKTTAARTGTEIKPCVCANEYQDAKYGKGRRVHNIKPKGGAACTVCGSVK